MNTNPQDPAHAYNRDADEWIAPTEREAGEAFARAFSSFCNDMRSGPKAIALDRMIRDHRTIQQNMMRFCLAFIAQMADQRSDLRNEASVQLAKQIMERTDLEARILPKV